MKKFTINCDFNGQKAPFTVFIGRPQEGHHPLHFQAEWLSTERGGSIPQEVMDSIAKLQDLAKKNNVSLEDLCVYAIGSAEQKKDGEESEEDENLEEDQESENIQGGDDEI
jgi:hypothetical protein